MSALMAELDRRDIRTKVNGRRDGQKSGSIRFGVGPLAHLLKNRFYIGEVVYRHHLYLYFRGGLVETTHSGRGGVRSELKELIGRLLDEFQDGP
jgi:hypothetical protein